MLETTLLYKHIILKVKNALFIDTHTFTCIKIKTAKWRIIFPSNSKEKWLLFKFVCWVSNKCYRHVRSVLPGLEVVRLHVLLCSPWLPAGAAEQRWPQCPAFPASAFCLGLWLKPNVPERAENTKVNRGDGAWPIRATCLEHAMVNQPYLSGTEDILQYLSSLWLQLFVLVQKVVLSGPLNDLKEKNKHVHAYQIFYLRKLSKYTMKWIQSWATQWHARFKKHSYKLQTYFVIYVCDVHTVEDIILEVIPQYSSQNVKRYIGPKKKTIK